MKDENKKASNREFRGNLANVNGHRITYVVSTDSTDIKVLISDDEAGQQILIVYCKEKATFHSRQKKGWCLV